MKRLYATGVEGLPKLDGVSLELSDFYVDFVQNQGAPAISGILLQRASSTGIWVSSRYITRI